MPRNYTRKSERGVAKPDEIENGERQFVTQTDNRKI